VEDPDKFFGDVSTWQVIWANTYWLETL
jgi:hypothetical protein